MLILLNCGNAGKWHLMPSVNSSPSSFSTRLPSACLEATSGLCVQKWAIYIGISKFVFVFENPVKLEISSDGTAEQVGAFSGVSRGWLSKCFSFTYAFLTRSKWHLLGSFISLRQCCVFARGV